MSTGLTIDAACSQQAIETIHLKDGNTIEGTVLKADLNVIAVRRAIGGVRLLPNATIAEVELVSARAGTLVFRFDDWVNGATSFERGGEAVAIEDWVEPPPGQVNVATASEIGVDAAARPPEDGELPALTVSAAAGEEGGLLARLRLELSKPASAPIQLVYTTSDGTATAGADYTALAGIVTFEPGDQVNELEIEILDDEQAEGVEFLKLIVNADPALVSLDGASKILAIIRDND